VLCLIFWYMINRKQICIHYRDFMHKFYVVLFTLRALLPNPTPLLGDFCSPDPSFFILGMSVYSVKVCECDISGSSIRIVPQCISEHSLSARWENWRVSRANWSLVAARGSTWFTCFRYTGKNCFTANACRKFHSYDHSFIHPPIHPCGIICGRYYSAHGSIALSKVD